jgi:hypothetical protein
MPIVSKKYFFRISLDAPLVERRFIPKTSRRKYSAVTDGVIKDQLEWSDIK